MFAGDERVPCVRRQTREPPSVIPRPIMRLSTFLHIGLCITICACGEAPGAHTHRLHGDQPGAAGAQFKVALLTPGPISDQAWNAAAYHGLLRIKDSLGADVSNVETKTPGEFEENFRQYGAQGYNVIFANGFEYQDAVQRIAPDYPRSVFITTSGDRTGANWAGIDFQFEEGAYVAGILAGMITKTNVIATIGGTELPPVRRGFAGFAAGARSVNSGVRVLSSYVGNWDDASAAKEQALAQINQGADVIFQNADAAGLGVFQAAKDSKSVWIIGSNSDQNGVAPAVTLGSVVIDLPHALLTVTAEVRDGLFIPRVIKLGEAQQVVRFVVNPAIGPEIPSAARVAVDSVQRSLTMGHALPHIDLGPASSDTATPAHAPTGDSAARPPAAADSAKPAAPVPSAASTHDSAAKKDSTRT
jgi:basic membrane protein A and related proteins